MQSPLFAFNDQQTQERWSLQNKQMLRVALGGHDDILARKGSMIAYQGLVEFDAEYQSRGQARSRSRTGEGLDLMRCHGQGTVYLANLAQHIHVMDVDHEGLTVDSSYVLAMDSSLHHEVIAVDSLYGISGSGKYQLNITGQGKVALMTSGMPLLMQVTPDKYANCDADAIVAWSTGLRVRCRPRRTPPGCGGAAATPARAGSSASWAAVSHSFSPASCCRRRTPRSVPASPRSTAWDSRAPADRTRATSGAERRPEDTTGEGRPPSGRPSPVSAQQPGAGLLPVSVEQPGAGRSLPQIRCPAVSGSPPADGRPRRPPPPPPRRTGTSAGRATRR